MSFPQCDFSMHGDVALNRPFFIELTVPMFRETAALKTGPTQNRPDLCWLEWDHCLHSAIGARDRCLRSLPDPLSNRSASFAAFGSLSAAFSASANLAWPASETALALWVRDKGYLIRNIARGYHQWLF